MWAMGDTHTLIGRGGELEQLDAALSDAIERRGRVVLITGEPGIGKTALARTFVERASQRGAAWAWATCWDGGGAPAYWPWMQIARALTRNEDIATLRTELGDAAPWIAGLLPELAGSLGSPALSSDLNAEQARFRLFDALATLLANAAARRPLVIVLDDLHWSDRSSLMALEFLDRALPDLGILVVAAYRHSEAHARKELAAPLGGLARSALRLPLEGLGSEEVARLATARASWQGPAGAPGIPSRLVTAVYDASAGNPFFADELLQMLASQGRLYDDRSARDPLPLPGGVRDTIRRRLAPLDERSLHALRAAAVIGGRFRVTTLARVAGGSPSEMLERLDPALRAGIVAAPDDAGHFEFVHALVRDTLSSEIGATERAQLHLLVAEALEQEYGDDADSHLAEIAHHLLQGATGGAPARAVELAARAAERAIAQFAYHEAAQLYERAIEVAAALPPDDVRSWELHHGLGEALMRCGDVERSRAALRDAIQHARRLADPTHHARSALAGTLPGFSRRIADAELTAALEEAQRRLDSADPEAPAERAAIDALRCRVRVELAVALLWSPELERREQLVDEAFEIARALYSSDLAHGSPAQRTLADRTLAFVLATASPPSGDPTARSAACRSPSRRSSCASARGTPSWPCRSGCGASACCWSSTILAAPSRRSRRSARPRTASASRGRWSSTRCIARSWRTCAGSSTVAERLTAEAIEQSDEVYGSMSQLVADGQRFLQQRVRGRDLVAEPFLRRHAAAVPVMRRWRCMLAVRMADDGRLDDARKELDTLAAEDFRDFPRDALWLFAMALLAELCALLGDARRARLLYDLLAPFEGRNVISLGVAYLGPVARYLGLLAMTTGEAERALGHLETARSATRRTGALPMEVLTTLDTAEVLAAPRLAGRRGARRRARREASRATRSGSGWTGAIARVADLRERLAANRPAAREVPVAPRIRHGSSRTNDVWLLAYRGRTVHLQDAKGLRQLAALLASPGMPIPATALARRSGAAAAPRRNARGRRAERGDPEARSRAGGSCDDSRRTIAGSSAARIRAEPLRPHGCDRCAAYHPDPDSPLVWDVSA